MFLYFLAPSAMYSKNAVFLDFVSLFSVLHSLVEYYAKLFLVHESKFNDRIVYIV